MSLSDLLSNYPKPWANLYVNSINVAEPIPSQTFTLNVLALTVPPVAGMPVSINDAPFQVPGCSIERFSDTLYLFTTPQFTIPVGDQNNAGGIYADLSNSPLAGTRFQGSEAGFVRRINPGTAGNIVSTTGAAYVQLSNRLSIIGLNPVALVIDGDMVVEPINIWLRLN